MFDRCTSKITCDPGGNAKRRLTYEEAVEEAGSMVVFSFDCRVLCCMCNKSKRERGIVVLERGKLGRTVV